MRENNLTLVRQSPSCKMMMQIAATWVHHNFTRRELIQQGSGSNSNLANNDANISDLIASCFCKKRIWGGLGNYFLAKNDANTCDQNKSFFHEKIIWQELGNYFLANKNDINSGDQNASFSRKKIIWQGFGNSYLANKMMQILVTRMHFFFVTRK